MRSTTALAIAIAFLLAGCVSNPGGGSAGAADLPPQLVTANHHEVSEATVAEVTHVQGRLTYQDLRVVVNGVPLRFGPAANLARGTFAVSGVLDAKDVPALGDQVRIPAAGFVDVRFLDIASGEVLWSYQATVPDTTAPQAPLPAAPADHATGVATTPTLAWTASQDPSGVTYRLQVSLDPTFATPVVTMNQDHIGATTYTLTAGQALQPGQTYYWRVQPVDGAGNAGDWSPAVSFTTSATG